MIAIDNIKAALYRYYAAVEGVLATQAAEDPHAIALAIQEAEKSTRLLETWTQPDYIRELLAHAESLEKDAERLDWLDSQGVKWGYQGDVMPSGIEWKIGGAYPSIRSAIDAEMASQPPVQPMGGSDGAR